MIIYSKKDRPQRDPHDFYPTPPALCAAALGLLPRWAAPRSILDPGAGTGVWGEAARQRWPEACIKGVELRADAPRSAAYDQWHVGDFLSMADTQRYDLVMGNPPYKFAEQFIRKADTMLAHGGYILMLLRLAFLESQTRGIGLWRVMPPDSVHVLVQRPSFVANGKDTDMTAYAIFLWRAPHKGQPTLHWLDWQNAARTDMQLTLFGEA